ncbi:MAG TPA: AAA family ATPase [Pseudolabrys sp.]
MTEHPQQRTEPNAPKPIDIARKCIGHGWNPVPNRFKGKEPDPGKEWQKRVITDENVHHWFNGKPQNVGVQLGPKSGGLTDVDLDCREAREIAPYILPHTGSIFGRASARMSHRLYQTSLAQRFDEGWIPFDDPKGGHLLELRIGGGDKGAQTVLPGSVHESGELIAWEENGAPAKVDDGDLLKRVKLLAATCLLVRYWPKEGQRHDAALTVGGFLHRAGLDDGIIKPLMQGIGKAAGDNEIEDRIKAVLVREGVHARGYPKLAEMFGKDIANKVAEWLDYDSRAEAEHDQTTPCIAATPFTWVDPKTIPPREWLYRPHYIRKYASAIFSPGGGAKSSTLIAEVLAMVTRKSLLGIQSAQAFKCWYWNGEDPFIELQRRFAATCKHYALTPNDIDNRLFIDSGRTMPIVIAEDINRTTRVAKPVIEAVVATLIENQIDALIVDPFVSCHSVPENDNMAIDRVAKAWAHIAEVANCSIMLAHHTRKTGGVNVTTEDARGASALRDAVRTARTLNVMSDHEADNAEIPESERRSYFRSDIGKANLAPPAERADWFRLVSVDLENGPHLYGAGGDEVGVVTSWEYPRRDEPVVTADDIVRVQAAIKDGRWRADQRAKREPWVGVAIAQALDMDLSHKLQKRAVAKLVDDWVGAGYLKRFTRQDKDTHFEVVTYIEPGAKPGVATTRGRKRDPGYGKTLGVFSFPGVARLRVFDTGQPGPWTPE